MKAHIHLFLTATIFTGFDFDFSTARAQGTAFTYQGRLNDGANPANGVYDLRFTIYDALTNGNQIGNALTNSTAGVSNGLFTATLDFGGIFTGTNYWLDIGVRTNGADSFAGLSPRQQITPTPYAIFAKTASNLSGTLPASQLSGTIPSGILSGAFGNAVNFNNGANNFDGTFVGEFFGSSFFGGSFSGNFFGDGSGLSGLWRTAGNAGTSPGNNFVGTTDNQPLEFRVNNTRVLRLEPDPRGANAGNIIGGFPGNAVEQPGSGSDFIGSGGYPGIPNTIHSNSSGVFIGGGSINQIGPNVNDSVIAGGYGNTIQEFDSAIGGGSGNSIQPEADHATIAGGFNNSIQTNAWDSAIGGGYGNGISPFAEYSVIGGGIGNLIQFNSYYSAIGGGGGNNLYPFNFYSGIFGGENNSIRTNANFSFIGGGIGNTIGDYTALSVIVGGANNTIITGQLYNFIGGGVSNSVGGWGYAFVGGGAFNQAYGYGAVVPGGISNTASGNGSFAAGAYAQAINDGSFVWADNSSLNFFSSTTSNQFLIRAQGGVGINTNNPGVSALFVNGDERVAGLLRSGSETGTAEAPLTTGIVTRRINNTSTTTNQIVARTDVLMLERDGSNGGFHIRYGAITGEYTIACMGINSSGTQVNFFSTVSPAGVAGITQIYSNSQNIVHFECTFGDTFDSGGTHQLTQVILSRANSDFYWGGFITSTYNQ